MARYELRLKAEPVNGVIGRFGGIAAYVKHAFHLQTCSIVLPRSIGPGVKGWAATSFWSVIKEKCDMFITGGECEATGEHGEADTVWIWNLQLLLIQRNHFYFKRLSKMWFYEVVAGDHGNYCLQDIISMVSALKTLQLDFCCMFC